jgi:WD40-like Beta Propeller Repeat
MLRRTFVLGTAAALAGLSQGSIEDSAGAGSLAYIEDATLWIKRLPDGTPRALASGSSPYEPRFSPSGRWILFRDRGDLLRLVSSDGARSKNWPASGEWMPGRDHLLLDDTTLLSEDNDWNSPLKTFTDPVGAISRDGRRHAWTTSDGNGTRLFTGPFSEAGEPKLVAEVAEGGFQILSFLRRGSQFLYWMTDEDGADAWSYGMDICLGGGTQVIKTGISTLVEGNYRMTSLCPTADVLAAALGGDHLMDGGHSLVLANVSADATSSVTPVTGPLVTVMDPAWSPDGRQLAWTQGPDSDALDEQLRASGVRQRRIWLAGEGGLGAPAQLTDDTRFADEMPIWSRDGKYILFGRFDEKDTRSVWLMRADGSGARKVAGHWQPDDLLLSDWPSLFDWSASAAG